MLKEDRAGSKFSTSTTHGHDIVPMKAISGFLQARGEEMLRADWPQSWGKAYDAIVYQEGAFRRLEELTYTAGTWSWTATTDPASLTQGPVVSTRACPWMQCYVYKAHRRYAARDGAELPNLPRGDRIFDGTSNQPEGDLALLRVLHFRVQTPREVGMTLYFAVRSAMDPMLTRRRR